MSKERYFKIKFPTSLEIKKLLLLTSCLRAKSIVRRLFALPLLSISLLNGCVNSERATTELTVSAAASMQNVLAEIEQLYQQEQPQVELSFNFGSSGSLQRQIEQGAPIDIFISAAPQQMDDLEAQKLLMPQTRQDIAGNQMVLIVASDAKEIANFDDLTNEAIKKIALGEPNSVPAGQYAGEILANLNLADAVATKSVYGKNVRQVLNYVATGNVDAGIVYRTDAHSAPQVKIVAAAPGVTHSPVIYPAAVIKDSQNSQAARQMLQFLATPKAQEIFQQHGFISIN